MTLTVCILIVAAISTKSSGLLQALRKLEVGDKELQEQEGTRYGDVNTAKWCRDAEEHEDICDGDVDSCFVEGMNLCDQMGDGCFGVMVNPGWAKEYKGVWLCTSDVLVNKGDWLTRMKYDEVCAPGYTYCSIDCCDWNNDCYCDQSCNADPGNLEKGCSYNPEIENRCHVFDCQCQGLSNYYGTENGKTFGCTPWWAQEWWKKHTCKTVPRVAPDQPYEGCTKTLCDTTIVTGLQISGRRDNFNQHCSTKCKCQSGRVSNGGRPVNVNGVCQHWCSKDGMCGEGGDYTSGDDCRGCTVSKQVQDDGCCSDGDFNKNAGGYDIFLWQDKYDFNPSGKGLIALEMHSPNDASANPCSPGYELVTGCCGNDFNSGASGDWIYLCALYAEFGDFIDEIKMFGSTNSHWDPPCNSNDGWHKLDGEGGGDFNEGTGGSDHMHIYICYHQIPKSQRETCILPSRVEDTRRICQKIVDDTNAAEGYPITQIEIQGIQYVVDWDIYEWEDKATVMSYDDSKLGGPYRCASEVCSHDVSQTESHTYQWNIGAGIEVSTEWEWGFSAGVPGIAEISGSIGVGISANIHCDRGEEATFESQVTTTYFCDQREYATECTIWASKGTYKVLGMATPIFTIYGAEVKCKDFVDAIQIEWYGQAEVEGAAVETIICNDDPHHIEECQRDAREDLCQTDTYIKWNCPGTCNEKWGVGPPSCGNGVYCNWKEPEACPPPFQLEPHMELPKCRIAIYNPNEICWADQAFTNEGAPEDWQIENCDGVDWGKDGGQHKYSIWQWVCEDIDEVTSPNLGSTSTRTDGDKKQAFKETWTERHYKEHTWTPLSIFAEGVNNMNVMTCILAIIGVFSIIAAFKNRCMKRVIYTTIEDVRSKI